MATPATDLGRRWRNTPVVREMDNRRVLWFWRILAGLLVAGLPVIAYLLQHMEYVRMNYAIEDLRAREARLLEAERRLRIERAVLQSLPEVEAKAAKKLGLAAPAPGHVVVVRPEEVGRAPASRRSIEVPPDAR